MKKDFVCILGRCKINVNLGMECWFVIIIGLRGCFVMMRKLLGIRLRWMGIIGEGLPMGRGKELGSIFGIMGKAILGSGKMGWKVALEFGSQGKEIAILDNGPMGRFKDLVSI